MICGGICRLELTPENVAHLRGTLARAPVWSAEPFSEVEILRLDLQVGERRLRRSLGRRPTDLELTRYLLPGRSAWGFDLARMRRDDFAPAGRRRA